MAAINTLVSKILKNHIAQQIVESVNEPANTIYYVFAGNHVPYLTDDPPVPVNTTQVLVQDTYTNMIFGKRVTINDIKLMVKRNNWESGTIYEMYEHDVSDILDKNFFVVVDKGSFYHVFKCLFNNNGTPSLIQPDFAHAIQESDLFDVNDGYYRTSDGYQWKYMYSIDSTTFDKFATSEYIPVIANTEVSDAAVDGSIDVIKVESGGSRYDNHYRSNFKSGDLRVSSNSIALVSYSSDVMYSLGDNIDVANSSGSVAVTSGQSNIIGTSTLFTNDFSINDYVKIANSTAYEIKKIVSITNNTVMAISGNFSNSFATANVSVAYPLEANPANGFYQECVLLISSGTGDGQYKKIVDYVNDGIKKIAVLESSFSINPDTTSKYEVTPYLKIVGGGTETVNCTARALVNTAAANSVYEIQILDRGEFYKMATAEVLTSNVIAVANVAVLKPIISPFKGHGSDVNNELGATFLGISVKFSNTENGSVSVENDFRTIGILKDPLFANVSLTVNRISDSNPGADGTFIYNEKVYQIEKLKLAGNVAVSSTSANVDGTGTDFSGLSTNDTIIINSGTNWFIANVASVVNTTQITVSSDCSFTNSVSSIYLATITSEGYARNYEPTTLLVANSQGFFVQDSQIIGSSSFATALISNTASNGVAKNDQFLTYSQLSTFVGVLNGEFIEDEIIWQGTSYSNATFTAKYHSISNSNTALHYTNAVGFIEDGIVYGQTSESTFSVTTKYNGDLVFGSGLPIYLQYGGEVSRANNQTENIKIILEF